MCQNKLLGVVGGVLGRNTSLIFQKLFTGKSVFLINQFTFWNFSNVNTIKCIFAEQPFKNGFHLRLWWHQWWTFVQWNLLGKPLCSNLSNLILYQCAAFCNQLNNHWNILNTQWQTNTCLMSLLITKPLCLCYHLSWTPYVLCIRGS